jgi:lysozyme family protein
MKDNFGEALSLVLHHEGGYVDHPKDPGGRTNMGITQRVYESYLGREVTEEDMRSLSPNHASEIYRRDYWDTVKGDELPLGIDYAVFDWAVNSGPGTVARELQKLVGVSIDGVIGPQTLAAVNSEDIPELITKLAERRASFYRRLQNFTVFGKGWINRTSSTKEQAISMASETV